MLLVTLLYVAKEKNQVAFAIAIYVMECVDVMFGLKFSVFSTLLKINKDFYLLIPKKKEVFYQSKQ